MGKFAHVPTLLLHLLFNSLTLFKGPLAQGPTLGGWDVQAGDLAMAELLHLHGGGLDGDLLLAQLVEAVREHTIEGEESLLEKLRGYLSADSSRAGRRWYDICPRPLLKMRTMGCS